MIKLIILALIIFYYPSNQYAQKVKITKIHNTNLFEIEDGTFIKLAGVDAPRIDHPDSLLALFAGEILSYAETTFLHGKLNIEYTDTTIVENAVNYVYLSRGNIFYTVDFNELFLKWGYGKFIDNVDSTHLDIYIQAEKTAKENSSGIWEFVWISEYNSFDNQTFNSLPEEINTEWKYYYDRSAGKIALEMAAGPVTGYISAIAIGIVAAGMGEAINKEGFEYGMTGGAIGFIIGNSLGVYLVAKGGNKDLSLWRTIVSGIIGTSIGGGLTYLMRESNYGWIPGVAGITLGPVIYVNLIAPPPVLEDNKLNNTDLNKPCNMSHKDFYNSSIIFQQELIRILF